MNSKHKLGRLEDIVPKSVLKTKRAEFYELMPLTENSLGENGYQAMERRLKVGKERSVMAYNQMYEAMDLDGLTNGARRI